MDTDRKNRPEEPAAKPGVPDMAPANLSLSLGSIFGSRPTNVSAPVASNPSNAPSPAKSSRSEAVVAVPSFGGRQANSRTKPPAGMPETRPPNAGWTSFGLQADLPDSDTSETLDNTVPSAAYAVDLPLGTEDLLPGNAPDDKPAIASVIAHVAEPLPFDPEISNEIIHAPVDAEPAMLHAVPPKPATALAESQPEPADEPAHPVWVAATQTDQDAADHAAEIHPSPIPSWDADALEVAPWTADLDDAFLRQPQATPTKPMDDDIVSSHQIFPPVHDHSDVPYKPYDATAGEPDYAKRSHLAAYIEDYQPEGVDSGWYAADRADSIESLDDLYRDQGQFGQSEKEPVQHSLTRDADGHGAQEQGHNQDSQEEATPQKPQQISDVPAFAPDISVSDPVSGTAEAAAAMPEDPPWYAEPVGFEPPGFAPDVAPAGADFTAETLPDPEPIPGAEFVYGIEAGDTLHGQHEAAVSPDHFAAFEPVHAPEAIEPGDTHYVFEPEQPHQHTHEAPINIAVPPPVQTHAENFNAYENQGYDEQAGENRPAHFVSEHFVPEHFMPEHFTPEHDLTPPVVAPSISDLTPQGTTDFASGTNAASAEDEDVYDYSQENEYTAGMAAITPVADFSTQDAAEAARPEVPFGYHDSALEIVEPHIAAMHGSDGQIPYDWAAAHQQAFEQEAEDSAVELSREQNSHVASGIPGDPADAPSGHPWPELILPAEDAAVDLLADDPYARAETEHLPKAAATNDPADLFSVHPDPDHDLDDDDHADHAPEIADHFAAEFASAVASSAVAGPLNQHVPDLATQASPYAGSAHGVADSAIAGTHGHLPQQPPAPIEIAAAKPVHAETDADGGISFQFNSDTGPVTTIRFDDAAESTAVSQPLPGTQALPPPPVGARHDTVSAATTESDASSAAASSFAMLAARSRADIFDGPDLEPAEQPELRRTPGGAPRARASTRPTALPPSKAWPGRVKGLGAVAMAVVVAVGCIVGTWIGTSVGSTMRGTIAAPAITYYAAQDGHVTEISASIGAQLSDGNGILTIRGDHTDESDRNDLSNRLQAAQDRITKLDNQANSLRQLATEIQSQHQDDFYKSQITEVKQRIADVQNQRIAATGELDTLHHALANEEARLAGTAPQIVAAVGPSMLQQLLVTQGMAVKLNTPVAQVADCAHLYIAPHDSNLTPGNMVMVQLDNRHGALSGEVVYDTSHEAGGNTLAPRQLVVKVNSTDLQRETGELCPIGRGVTIMPLQTGHRMAGL